MPAGADFRLPAFPAHGETAADDFVNVGDGEGDMIDAGLAGAVEHEGVVMIAHALATHEHAVARIFVTDREAELFGVEGAHRGKIVGEQNDVADIDRVRLGMDGRARVDAVMRARGVDLRRLDNDRRALGDAEGQAHPVRIGDARQAVGAGVKAGNGLEVLNRLVELRLVGGAPDHLTHRVASFDRLRQIAGVLGTHDHLRAVKRPINQFVRSRGDLRHAPVVQKAL